MNVMLADSIDGGIFAILVLLLGGIASIIALIGLVPARQGNRPLAFLGVSPAASGVIVITGWLGYQFFFTGYKTDGDINIMDFIGSWVILAGLPFVASGTTLLVLWRRRKRQQQAAEQTSQ